MERPVVSGFTPGSVGFDLLSTIKNFKRLKMNHFKIDLFVLF